MKLTTSHSLTILLQPKRSAASSSNGARREHDVNRDKKGIIKNYLFAEGNESKQKVFFDSIQTMRGRSIDNTFLIADEIQNTDVHTMEAIATRIDRGSKFVLLGNFAQIDEPSLRVPEKNGFYKLLKGLYEKDPGRR